MGSPLRSDRSESQTARSTATDRSPTDSAPRRPGSPARPCVLLAARFSHHVFFQHSRIGLFWAPNALLVAALVLTPRRWWWLAFAAAAIAHVTAIGAFNPSWRLAWQLVSNAAFAVGTAEALRRLVGVPVRLDSRRAVSAYLALTFVMAALLAYVAPAFVLSFLRLETFFNPSVAFTRLVLANVSPMLLVAPAVFACASFDHAALGKMPRRRWLEGTFILAGVVVASVIVFDASTALARFPWLLVVACLPLVWAAVRLGPEGAAVSLLVVLVLSIWGATRDHGPFVALSNDDVVRSLHIYWLVIAPPILLLAAELRERERRSEIRRRQHNQLAETARLAVARELSGALANELRQPLTAIFSNAQAASLMLRRDHFSRVTVREMLDHIEEQDREAAAVIARMRRRVEVPRGSWEVVHIQTLVNDALALGADLIACDGVEVETELLAHDRQVRGDALQVAQAVLNVIINASEATKEAGGVGKRRIHVRVAPSGDEHVNVIVRDRGAGLPDDSHRLFEPFFTTKPERLGLGLAIARSIVTAHGGTLRAENNSDGGATFNIILPTHREK